MAKKYGSLYIQTEYSLLASMISLSKLKASFETYNFEAAAITDNGMHGAFKFYNLCNEINVKPIIGLRVSLYNQNFENIVLLYAKDNEGYKSLIKISSNMAINKDQINLEYLHMNNKGILAIIPVLENELNVYYNNQEYKILDDKIEEYKYIFEDCYLGISMQTQIVRNNNDDFLRLASKHQLEAVAINRSAYFSENEIDAYQILKSIALNNKVQDDNYNRLSDYEQSLSLLSSEEMELQFQKYPQLLLNTKKIIDKCNVKLNYTGYHFPKSLVNANPFEYLTELCKVGLNKRLKNLNLDYNTLVLYKKRLLYELNVINKMGFNDYFLIVYDYVRYAKTHDIYVGPGRGSAGGSLVSYSLGITDVDPIKYNLLFERFLNPERVGMPDIDVDFEDNKRENVIRYIGEKYGVNKVAHITTFGTFKSRLAIRDVSRILNLNDIKLKEIMKFISANLSIKESINNSTQLQRMIKEDEEIAKVINIASEIEFLPKNYSTHAAGIIMADTSLNDYTPLQEGIDGLYQTQYEASDLEQIGLVKMDILGLKNLSIIKNIVNQIKLEQNIDVDLRNIPFDDAETFKNIASGNTLGIFQLEGEGVTKVLKNLKTSKLDDIINATALYRPGPMEMIPSFIRRKFGLEKIEYLDPSMEESLKDTYGTIVFQEQIMQIASAYAGYSLAEADILRRAVSKKKAKVIEQEKERFIKKAISNGKDVRQATKVYCLIEKFASYGFNKSHAVAYGIIAYQMSYLKTHYYKAFMAAIMTNYIGDVNALSLYIGDLKKNKINIFPPSINISNDYFVYDDKGIYFSLLGISNIGNTIVNQILEVRKDGLFKSYNDFVFRTKDILNKKIVYSLVYSGAMDEFIKANHITRKYMVTEYENILQKMSYLSVLNIDIDNEFIDCEEYTYEEISNYEKEALGLNIQFDIFLKYQSVKERYKAVNLNQLILNNTMFCLFIIKRIKEINTKKNDKMAFLSVSDSTLTMDGVIFPLNYKKYNSILEINRIYIAKVKLDNKDNKSQIIIDDLFKL